jgi:hypothetical protein
MERKRGRKSVSSFSNEIKKIKVNIPTSFEEQFEVEAILDIRTDAEGKEYYLVKTEYF